MTRRFVPIAVTWLVPLSWTVLWGLFRGENAHGGFVWWRDVHYGGLLLLSALATVLTKREPNHIPKLLRNSVVAGSALVFATWLAFQAGLAKHQPPDSIIAFVLNEP